VVERGGWEEEEEAEGFEEVGAGRVSRSLTSMAVAILAPLRDRKQNSAQRVNEGEAEVDSRLTLNHQ